MIISNEKIAPPAATVPHGTVDAAVESTSHHNAGVFDTEYLRNQNLIGKKIAEARKVTGLSQKELSSRLVEYGINISSGSISKWEKGDALPNPYQLLAICHILRINEFLQYFTGSTPEPQDYTSELNQKGLNLLQMFKETLIASGKYAPHSRRGFTEPKPQMMGISCNMITNWEEYEPKVDSLRKLCTTLGIPLDEFFSLYNKFVPSKHESVILSQYRQLSPIGRKAVDHAIHAIMGEELDAHDRYLEEAFFLLPIKSSFLPISTDQPSEYAFVKRTGYNEAAEAAIRVSDASLEPYYHDGDLVYISYTENPAEGDIVICSTTGGIVIRQLMNNLLYPLNRALPYDGDDTLTVVGKIIGRLNSWDLADEEDIPVLEEVKAADIRAFKQKYGLL